MEGFPGTGAEHWNPNAGGIEREEQNGQERGGKFTATIGQIREYGAQRLADYLENTLSEGQRDKINGALLAKGEVGIEAFPWVKPVHQDEAINLLNDIAIAEDGKAIRDMAETCKKALTRWEQEDEER